MAILHSSLFFVRYSDVLEWLNTRFTSEVFTGTCGLAPTQEDTELPASGPVSKPVPAGEKGRFRLPAPTGPAR